MSFYLYKFFTKNNILMWQINAGLCTFIRPLDVWRMSLNVATVLYWSTWLLPDLSSARRRSGRQCIPDTPLSRIFLQFRLPGQKKSTRISATHIFRLKYTVRVKKYPGWKYCKNFKKGGGRLFDSHYRWCTLYLRLISRLAPLLGSKLMIQLSHMPMKFFPPTTQHFQSLNH